MAELTNEEVIEIHKDYTEMHKKAFRVAFDTLMKLWPPHYDPEWFVNTAAPACQLAYESVKGNALGERLVMEVLAYLEDTVRKMRGKK